MVRSRKAGVMIRRNTDSTSLGSNMKGDVLMVLGREARKWGFPKGSREKGESYIQAAIREGHEETGLVCAIDEDAQMYRIGSTIYFDVHLSDDTLGEIMIRDTKEIMDYKWVSAYELVRGSMPDKTINYDVREFIKGKIKRSRKRAAPQKSAKADAPDEVSTVSFETVEDVAEELKGLKL